MKKVLIVTLLMISLLIAPKAFAHELFIQVKEDQTSNELQVDVLWGHLRDFIDQGNPDNYELFVKLPNGQTKQLEMERIGVQARAFIPASETGQYVFWAMRKPSTYTPGDEPTRLSLQRAKTVYHVGSGDNITNHPVGLDLEIIPETNLAIFNQGLLKGNVLFEGNPQSNVTVTAYGPAGEHFEGVTGADGAFEFNLRSNGEWLIKASFQTDESGTLDDTDYELTGRTTTLIFDNSYPIANENNYENPLMYIAVLLIGLLLGSAFTFLILKRKK
ncbi:DUF4198 domain-containing protein [Anaerobacillus alkaliphilus]|uniref:DUF4198 domain-containing protein n=1 Tax=Anaerobacillus alkaliphilus TaxID=1548597 RepID=A0A4Q0VSW2_9BACI|nr:DUF4198 domain-containing protein [Anaerobacillus alkaliphilus]RXJ00309.1 DUF4198 domain-containing protein [Anaerobacillus alkaliphilus]